jgi:hypothetical protein
VTRNGNSDVGLGHLWVLDSIGAGMCIILYLWVTSAPDSHRDGYGCGFSFAPAGGLTGA